MTAYLPAVWAALLLAGAWTIRPRPHPRPVLVTPRRGFLRPDVTRTLAGMVAALVIPLPFVPVMAFGLWAVPVVRRRRAVAQRDAAIIRSLPEVVDLFHLGVTAGLTVPLAVEAVARRSHGPLGDELRVALEEVALGRRLGDALDDVPARAGEVVRPLVAALVASDRYGAPLGDALGRLASEVRADRRRRAEEAARKVPVKLLFPLVCCVLPAFGLLTLAPLIAGAVAALGL
jgi:tight adherence protein C